MAGLRLLKSHTVVGLRLTLSLLMGQRPAPQLAHHLLQLSVPHCMRASITLQVDVSWDILLKRCVWNGACRDHP